jgi:hypothetical protein
MKSEKDAVAETLPESEINVPNLQQRQSGIRAMPASYSPSN